MLKEVTKIVLLTLAPVLLSTVMYLIDKKTSFGKLKKGVKQLIFGLIFGALAVLGTEFGVSVDGATLNVRDAAPLCAGLFFGAPAGIIAGVIGGVERWFAVLWGAGSYTRLACTLGTIFAGLFGAALRRWLFDDKKTSWYYGLSTGVVTEILHMLLIFIINMDDVSTAFSVVRKIAPTMILCNGVAVMLSAIVISRLSGERIITRKKDVQEIAHAFQQGLFVCVIIAFAITNGFILMLQSNLSENSAESLLKLNIEDVKADIEDASDQNLLKITHRIATQLNALDTVDDAVLVSLEAEYGVSEISIINDQGIIAYSTFPIYKGFDMASGTQSSEFLALLSGETEYVQPSQPISRDSATVMKYAGVALKKGGFVQVGYDAEGFQKEIDQQVVGITRNRHVGKDGYIIVVDSQMNIVSDRNQHEGENLSNLGWDSSHISSGTYTLIPAVIYDENCYCMYAVAEGYYVVAVMPQNEALFSRDVSVYITAFMETLIFAALFILIYLLIKKLVVENIHRVNGALSEITGGNLSVVVDVRTNEEFASLSDDINSTVVTLKRYIAEAAARIDRELEFAQTIQKSTLPSIFPPFPDRKDVDIFASMSPAKEVGGDFYDFYLLPGNRVAFLIADVSGKGISAAMFMMTAKTLIKSLAEMGGDAAAILTLANAELCKNNEAEMFVTCWMGILDLRTGVVDYANAGHNPPVVRSRDGSYTFLKSRPGFVLAGMDGMNYRRGEYMLLPGDEIFLYTDGVTEATNGSSELYGDDRLLAALNAQGRKSAVDLCHSIKADVDAFVGDAPQFDDITMLSLKLDGGDCLALHPDMEAMAKVMEYMEKKLGSDEIPKNVSAKMYIAIDEIYSNVIQYSGAEHSLVCFRVENDCITLTVADDGKPYNPLDAEDPDTSLSAEEREEGGLGVFMVKKSMDSVEYHNAGGRNILTLTKTFRRILPEPEEE